MQASRIKPVRSSRDPTLAMAKVLRNASLLLVAATTATALTSSPLSTSAGPPQRDNSVAVVDATNNRLLIHGGTDGKGRLDDLWAYDLDGNSWTELNPTGTKPSARDEHVAAVDTSTNKLLIHGGNDGSGALDQLWAYDLVNNLWTDLSPIVEPMAANSPQNRESHVAAMDTSNGRLLIHGGKYGSSFLYDLWAYDLDGNSWTELLQSGTKPSARYGHVAAIDASTNRLLIFGGRDSENNKDDLWAYDLVNNGWTAIEFGISSSNGQPPLRRHSHVAAMDTSNGRLLIHAGSDGSSWRDDLWAYDLDGNIFTELTPTGTMPSARYGHVAALDASNTRLLIFSGQSMGGVLDDLWQFAWVTTSTTTNTTTTTTFTKTTTTFTNTTTSTSATTTTATITNTTTVDDTAESTADDTANTAATSTSTARTEVSTVCKGCAPSLFFPLFCVASLATM
jgi:hypothetical protein